MRGVNGESGADYKESSPRSWNGESWPNYIELFTVGLTRGDFSLAEGFSKWQVRAN